MKGPVFFWLFAALSILPALFVLLTRDIVRMAFWLLASFAGFAGLYGLLGADFLAFTQVIVYIGGILVLFLFGVMLTYREPILVKRIPVRHLVVPGILAGVVATLGILRVVAARGSPAPPGPGPEETARTIGEILMSDYLLPFEVASVVLLVALVGATYIARRRGGT